MNEVIVLDDSDEEEEGNKPKNGQVVQDLTNDDVVYKTSGTDGHVLQVNASGVPFFGHIDCGTY